MTPNHLHLHVVDIAAARAFYQQWFGLRAKCWRGPVLFLRSEDGFDLALEQVERVEPMPRGVHFGFRLDEPEMVRALHASMVEASYPVQDLHAGPELVWFRVRDPDKYPIEVYWEPREP